MFQTFFFNPFYIRFSNSSAGQILFETGQFWPCEPPVANHCFWKFSCSAAVVQDWWSTQRFHRLDALRAGGGGVVGIKRNISHIPMHNHIHAPPVATILDSRRAQSLTAAKPSQLPQLLLLLLLRCFTTVVFLPPTRQSRCHADLAGKDWAMSHTNRWGREAGLKKKGLVSKHA